MAAFDVIVVGGGVVGLSTAYHLVQAGAKTLLIDKGHAGRATDAGAGILSAASDTAAPDPYDRFAAQAARYYPLLIDRLAAEGAVDAGYAVCGSLTVAVSEDEMAAFEQLRASRRSQGEGWTELSSEEARAVPAAGSRAGCDPLQASCPGRRPPAGGSTPRGGARARAQGPRSRGLGPIGRAWRRSERHARWRGAARRPRGDRGRCLVEEPLRANWRAGPGRAAARPDRAPQPAGHGYRAAGRSRGRSATTTWCHGPAGSWSVRPARAWALRHVPRLPASWRCSRKRSGRRRAFAAPPSPRRGSACGRQPPTACRSWAEPGIANLHLATGHGAVGLQLGPFSGKMIADAITRGDPGVDLAPFAPGRWRRPTGP
jgi:D-amino-acid dehydrogenase